MFDGFRWHQAKFRSGANRISTAFWASAVTSPQWKMLTNSKEHTNAEAYNFILTNLEVPMCSGISYDINGNEVKIDQHVCFFQNAANLGAYTLVIQVLLWRFKRSRMLTMSF